MITAERAAKLIAPHVNKNYDMHKSILFDILRLAANKAWQEGRFYGMSKEFIVNTRKDDNGNSYFLAPKDFSILLGVNINNRASIIRGRDFQFHRNGYGSIDKNHKGCSWFEEVMDCGAQPVIEQPNIKLRGPVMIGFRSLSGEAMDAEININGVTTDGNKLITYQAIQKASSTVCGCNQIATAKKTIDVVYGSTFRITNAFTYIDNVCFESIESITKSVTLGPVEVVAIHKNGEGYLLARLEAHEITSKYRKYLVPNTCGCTQTVHGSFKISQQENIAYGSQPLIIENEEAIISLAIGIYKQYYTSEIQEAQFYISEGLKVLDKEKREEDSPNVFPIQIDGIHSYDIPDVISRN